jgi:hypothetical protein
LLIKFRDINGNESADSGILPSGSPNAWTTVTWDYSGIDWRQCDRHHMKDVIIFIQPGQVASGFCYLDDLVLGDAGPAPQNDTNLLIDNFDNDNAAWMTANQRNAQWEPVDNGYNFYMVNYPAVLNNSTPYLTINCNKPVGKEWAYFEATNLLNPGNRCDFSQEHQLSMHVWGWTGDVKLLLKFRDRYGNESGDSGIITVSSHNQWQKLTWDFSGVAWNQCDPHQIASILFFPQPGETFVGNISLDNVTLGAGSEPPQPPTATVTPTITATPTISLTVTTTPTTTVSATITPTATISATSTVTSTPTPLIGGVTLFDDVTSITRNAWNGIRMAGGSMAYSYANIENPSGLVGNRNYAITLKYSPNYSWFADLLSAAGNTPVAASYLSFQVRGAQGGEGFQVGMASSGSDDYLVQVLDWLPGGITTDWKKVIIPFSAIQSYKTNVSTGQPSWNPNQTYKFIIVKNTDHPSGDPSGTVYIDDIAFGNPYEAPGTDTTVPAAPSDLRWNGQTVTDGFAITDLTGTLQAGAQSCSTDPRLEKVTFDYSLDSGATWTTIGERYSGGSRLPSDEQYSVSCDLSAIPNGTVQLRATAYHVSMTSASLVRTVVMNRTGWLQDGQGVGFGSAGSLAINPQGVPYAVIRKDGHDCLRYWNGSGWQQVGSPLNRTVGAISDNSYGTASVAFYNNTPFVLWTEKTDSVYLLYLSHWDGNGWVHNGGALNVDAGVNVWESNLVIAGDGTPYVAWQEFDTTTNKWLYVKHWNGSVWVQDGGSLITPAMFINSFSLTVVNNTPYVAWNEVLGYDPNNARLRMKYWDGSAWVEDDGWIGNSSANCGNPVMSVYNGMPYVQCCEMIGSQTLAYVKHKNGSTWVQDGPAWWVYDRYTKTCFAVSNGVPYAIYTVNGQLIETHLASDAWVQDGGSLNSFVPLQVDALEVYNGAPYVLCGQPDNQLIEKHLVSGQVNGASVSAMHYPACGTRTPTPSPTQTITATSTITATPTQTAVQALAVATSTPTATATVTATSTRDIGAMGIAAYPNPARDRVNFVWKDGAADKVRVEIYNPTGERITKIEVNNPGGAVAWLTSHVPAGIYYYQIFITRDGQERGQGVRKIAIIK